MFYGMEHEQFLKFRMTLTPSSGFQSLQFRLVEIRSTDLKNLVSRDVRNTSSEESAEALYSKIYWKKGATETSTGKKTLSLIHFEEKYDQTLAKNAVEFEDRNLWRVYKKHFSNNGLSSKIIEELKNFDQLANVFWPLAHYKSASRYLQQKTQTVSATGGTNWQMYLPPHYQKVIYFPELWTQEEQETWGKQWVVKEVFKEA